jgi:hypothetical protein
MPDLSPQNQRLLDQHLANLRTLPQRRSCMERLLDNPPTEGDLRDAARMNLDDPELTVDQMRLLEIDSWERMSCVEALLSIPVKWGTDSGEVGQRQSKATLAMAMISEVPHLSQEVRGS